MWSRDVLAAGSGARARAERSRSLLRIEELEHTADVGFEVEADDLAGLFEGAARGLLDALGVPRDAADGSPGPAARPGAGDARPLALSTPGLERLLVAWLRELLWEAQSEARLPEIASIEVDGGGPDVPATLRARLRWHPAAAAATREIKGVTYHGLRVAREADRWRARVIFDV